MGAVAAGCGPAGSAWCHEDMGSGLRGGGAETGHPL